MEEKEENKTTLSLEDFVQDPSLINSENFLKLIDLLFDNIENKSHYLIPFLELCPKLIKLYIEKDLGQEREDKFYKILKHLMENSFINRDYLNPIYEYFSDILYNAKEIKENDPKLLKFSKMQKLWKTFYDKENVKEVGLSSSICFNGGSVNLTPIYYYNTFEDAVQKNINNQYDLMSDISINIIFFFSNSK